MAAGAGVTGPPIEVRMEALAHELVRAVQAGEMDIAEAQRQLGEAFLVHWRDKLLAADPERPAGLRLVPRASVAPPVS